VQKENSAFLIYVADMLERIVTDWGFDAYCDAQPLPATKEEQFIIDQLMAIRGEIMKGSKEQNEGGLMKECNFICAECKNFFREKRFYMDCYPCCSKECFDVWIQKPIEGGIKELAETQDKSINRVCFMCKKAFQLSKFHLYGDCCSHECSIKEARITRSKVMAQEDQSRINPPSLKDFIGKECDISILNESSTEYSSADFAVINGSIKKYNYVYMGSEETCHIIQRKIDGQPDGIFFFPKAAVALRF
jgi:hypothetical protein